MIEVVFGDSACGSLKQAQRYGQGAYRSGAFGVVVSHPDGRRPTGDALEAARCELEAQERLRWAKATPMGGNPADVYGFAYGLSMGDISENIPGEKRRQMLEWLYSIYPHEDEGPAFSDALMARGKDTLESLCGRISAGEAVRIWYSSQPDELCGLYWFAAQLNRLKLGENQVTLVSLPQWEMGADGHGVLLSGWGGVQPGDWHRHLARQTIAPPAFIGMCAALWDRLVQENAPLRAVLNGRLVSVPETLYDPFIAREIEGEDSEFHEAMVIGSVLGKYQLGISDGWIAHRIEAMIAAGCLYPVTKAAPGSPLYHRRLKKL